MKELTTPYLKEVLGNSDCHRCGGTMVDDYFFGEFEVSNGRRCVQCGNVIDPVILVNRLQSPAPVEDQDDVWNPPEESIPLGSYRKVA